MKKLALVASIVIALALGFQLGVSNAWAAAKKVDCTKVMEELNAGKKVAVVAKDLKISRSSVYRCRREARANEKKEKRMGKETSAPAAAATAGK